MSCSVNTGSGDYVGEIYFHNALVDEAFTKLIKTNWLSIFSCVEFSDGY